MRLKAISLLIFSGALMVSSEAIAEGISNHSPIRSEAGGLGYGAVVFGSIFLLLELCGVFEFAKAKLGLSVADNTDTSK